MHLNTIELHITCTLIATSEILWSIVSHERYLWVLDDVFRGLFVVVKRLLTVTIVRKRIFSWLPVPCNLFQVMHHEKQVYEI